MRAGIPILDADGHVVEPGHVFADVLPHGADIFDLPATTPYEMCGDLELLLPRSPAEQPVGTLRPLVDPDLEAGSLCLRAGLDRIRQR